LLMEGSGEMDDERRDFFKVKVNYAIVINGDLEAIEQLKRFLADEGFRVIYQRKSLARLIVKEEK
jgi:hypothetical protein